MMNGNPLASVLIAGILLLSTGAYASAETAAIVGASVAGRLTAADTVTVRATVNPTLAVAVVTPAAGQTVDFGSIDPGATYGPQALQLTVQSNRTYNVTVSKIGDASIGLTTTLANSVNNVETAGRAFTDSYGLNVPWSTSPGAHTSTVQYTVVQN